MLKQAESMLKWAIEKDNYTISEKIGLNDYRHVHESLGIGFIALEDIKVSNPKTDSI